MDMKYRIGWEVSPGKWKYITVFSKEEMLAETAEKSRISDKVSVKASPCLKLSREG